MKPVNIDKTIEELLKKYAVYIKGLLAKQEKYIEDLHNAPHEQERLRKEYVKAFCSYKYLLRIASNPKRYLYNKENFVWMGVDAEGIPDKELGALSREESIFTKLGPALALDKNGNGGTQLFARLSESISKHVKYAKKGDWIYSGLHTFDTDAEMVLRINKYVNLLGNNDFVRFFKDMLPPHKFAVLAYSEKVR